MSKRNRQKPAPTVTAVVTAAGQSAEEIESALRVKAYDEFRRELTVKQNSNSENYDKSILTLSSAGLGLSLAFIKDIVPLGQVDDRSLLLWSWAFFAVAIVITLCSFQFSQMAIQTAMSDAQKYYIGRQAEYQSRPNVWAKLTGILNWASGAFFIFAVIATACFVFSKLPPPKRHEPTAPAITAEPAASPPGGHAPAPEAKHGAASQPAASDSPNPQKIKP